MLSSPMDNGVCRDFDTVNTFANPKYMQLFRIIIPKIVQKICTFHSFLVPLWRKIQKQYGTN